MAVKSCDPRSPATLYAGTSDGVYKSIDYGDVTSADQYFTVAAIPLTLDR